MDVRSRVRIDRLHLASSSRGLPQSPHDANLRRAPWLSVCDPYLKFTSGPCIRGGHAAKHSRTREDRRKTYTLTLSSTMLGCCSSRSREISLSAVLGMPSSSTSSLILCRDLSKSLSPAKQHGRYGSELYRHRWVGAWTGRSQRTEVRGCRRRFCIFVHSMAAVLYFVSVIRVRCTV